VKPRRYIAIVQAADGYAAPGDPLDEAPPVEARMLSTVRADDYDRLASLVAVLWLYTDRHTESQLTTEEKELFYNTVKAYGEPDISLNRWWRS
jgi:hypothetical protein